MFWLNSAELILMMGACATCSVSIIYAVCVNMRLSRCARINACCFSCDRDVETAEEIAMELANDRNRQRASAMPKNDDEPPSTEI